MLDIDCDFCKTIFCQKEYCHSAEKKNKYNNNYILYLKCLQYENFEQKLNQNLDQRHATIVTTSTTSAIPFISGTSSAATYSHEYRIAAHLFDNSGYRSYLRPVQNLDDTLNVNIQANVFKLSELVRINVDK